MSDWSRYGTDSGGASGAGAMDHEQHRVGMRDRASHGIENVRHRAGEVGSRARGGVEGFFSQHPLISGFSALALGMAVGMLIPHTRQEDRLMGDAAERMKERTRETAHKLGDVARSSLEEARDTAMQELEGKGLDPKQMKESVREAAHGVKEAAEKAAQEAKETAKQEAKRKNLQ